MDPARPKAGVIVTGANGFIGGHLVERLAQEEVEIHALQRHPDGAAIAAVTQHRWALGDPAPVDALERAGVLVHCAFQAHGPGGEQDSDRVNVEGTRRLIESCRAADTRLVFLSTLSAHSDATSHYGRHKLELEGLFEENDLVLKLGLVIGSEGLFGRMIDTIQRSLVVPAFDGGGQPVQCVAVEDVLTVIRRAVDSGLAGTYHLAERDPTTVLQVQREIADALEVRRLFVPVPSAPVLWLLRQTERLGMRLPISSENLIGLRNARPFDTGPDLDRLAITLMDRRAAIQRAVTTRRD